MMSVKSGAMGMVAALCLACAPCVWGDSLALPERQRAETRDDARFAGLLGQARQALSASVLEESSLRPSGRNPGLSAAVLNHHVGRTLTDWMESLGWVYAVTGETQYAEKGVELLLGTAERFPVSHPIMSGKGTMAGGRGDFMRGLAMGAHFFWGRLTAEQQASLRQCAEAYVRHFLSEAENPKTWWYGPHNFNGVCGGAAGLLTLWVEGMPEAESLRERIVAVLERWFTCSIDETGAYLEGAAYSQYGLSNSLLFASLLRDAGGRNLFSHPHVRLLPQYYAASRLPGLAVMDARNDSGYAPVGPECLLLAIHNRDRLASWLWQGAGTRAFPLDVLYRGRLPEPQGPEGVEPLNRLFGRRGLCVWRTGWGEEDVMFSTEAGTYAPITHNQSDKGHFTLYAYGDFWAVDPGYGNDNQFPDSRCHTLAHNCVLIDGKGQARSGCGTGTNGRVLAFENDDATGYALTDATEAYQRNVHNQPGAGARKALRHHLFVRPFGKAPAYAAVFDDIERDDDAHAFTWQMLSWDDKEVVPRADGALIRRMFGYGGDGYVWTPAGAARGACAWEFEVPEEGEYEWYAETSPRGAVLHQSDSFVVQVDDQPAVQFHCPSRVGWSWSRVTDGAVERRVLRLRLKAGRHTVTFRTREPEAAVAAVRVCRVQGEGQPSRMVASLGVSSATVTGGMRLERREEEASSSGDGRLVVVVVSPERLSAPSVDVYAPQDGRAPSALPRLRVMAERAVNPRFASLLLPLREGQAEPRVTHRRVGGVGTEYELDWGSHRDVVSWDGQGRPLLRREARGE